MSKGKEAKSDPVRATLTDAAYRLITEEGIEALTVRRLAQEAGTSTMAVYSRFGSISAVASEVSERAFVDFGAALTVAGTTDDPLADLMCQGLAYLRFATANPLLYTLMFQYTSKEWATSHRKSLLQEGSPTDSVSGRAAFTAMADTVRRASPADTDETALLIHAGVVWSTVHGLAMLSIAGHLGGAHDLVARSGLVTLTAGYGVARAEAEAAFARAEKRME